MASIIIVANGAPQSEQEQLMAQIASLPTEVFFVNSSAQASAASILTGLQSAAEKSTEDSLLLLDARVPWTREQVSMLLGSRLSGSSPVGVYEIDGTSFGSSGIGADDILDLCQSGSHWPTLAITVSRTWFIENLSTLSLEASVELMPRCVIAAISQHEEVSVLGDIDFDASEREKAESIAGYPNTLLSSLLRYAINNLDIEDFFPSHNWVEFSSESAAAGYHTLSAQFIRLGDFHAALEAVALGDMLEDSPRSLALKGLIAQMQGETLQAVANMVSSLQEYEKRKRDTENKHFVSFAPKDLDAINSDLKSGLEALNKRDNGSALLHFRSAVFNFDPFYTEMGLVKA